MNHKKNYIIKKKNQTMHNKRNNYKYKSNTLNHENVIEKIVQSYFKSNDFQKMMQQMMSQYSKDFMSDIVKNYFKGGLSGSGVLGFGAGSNTFGNTVNQVMRAFASNLQKGFWK